MRVMVDPGHYSAYINQSPVDPSYYESACVWKLALYIRDELRKRFVDVGLTRVDINTDVPVVKRGRKSEDYDLFISIHTNATGNSQGSEEANWPVCFCQVDGASTEIGNRIAKALMPLFKASKYECYSVANADGKDYYGVLRGAAQVKTPGLIIEHGFHTCKANVELLKQDSFLRKLAETDAEVIVEYLKKKEVQEVIEPASNTLYGKVKGVPEGDVLYVRTGPGSNYELLRDYSRLGNGNEIDILGRDNSQSWLYVRIAGKYFGWVYRKYIEII